ncbi:hypothetical protein A1O1_08937 [Capronia coronata CBS 617.96]|uniref:Uncharacterized protein n=1 Tax=Capronia coronata CBS 617.96 TaxID=1182541 RepID=W9XNK1_9EURO|nr:uncharacterized protein A1O1_08937 [Capronia coronata CBS 617.96]EXJ78536.1 hypothetical protein A1O1_08937 [Capronia coronata CBS 617.96]
MNHLRLGQCLGTVPPATFRRRHNESLINSLAHQKEITFFYSRPSSTGRNDGNNCPPPTTTTASASASGTIAHQAGVNCLAIDGNEGRYLFSGGADSTVRLWDLEEHTASRTAPAGVPREYHPSAALTRSTPSSHTHALTSISIYPFDPTPSTLLTTSYDKSLKVTSITPTSLVPVHTFDLDFLPYTHCVSSVPDSSPLIAVGTAHPAVRLLDLRSGLSTHSLSGPNGAVYTLAWSPRTSYILASGSADGRVLFYDIRRANAVFASLDSDDAVGVVGEQPSTGLGARTELLDFHTAAHNGPVTSVQWTPSGDRLVTAGHDQRIRVWDTATGRNELVHFGPRIRNERQGELKPLISPPGTHAPGRESLFWPNDDGRGVVFQHHLREGHLLGILRTEGVKVAEVQAAKKHGRTGAAGVSTAVARLTSAGRINAMVWRTDAPLGDGLEMYTAHGDGRICAWMPRPKDAPEEKDDDDDNVDDDESGTAGDTSAGGDGRRQLPPGSGDADDAADRKKRKRDLMADLVGGLARRPMRFS